MIICGKLTTVLLNIILTQTKIIFPQYNFQQLPLLYQNQMWYKVFRV